MRIISPVAQGNGAHVIHCQLEQHIAGYKVAGYHPLWTLMPLALPVISSCRGADLIHATPDHAVFHSTSKSPLVVTFHNYVLDAWMKMHSSRLQRIHYAGDLRWWTRMAVKRAKYITAVSYFLAELVKQDLGLTKPVRVIYNGINLDHFKPQAAARSNYKEIRVFFSGNLTRRKGGHWLPAIARHLSPNITVYYTSGLRTGKILASDKRLQPLGQIRFEDMPQRYACMDILLMPTVREGFGLAVAEAMACGLPVVASDCSSIPELIDDGQGGHLCPVGDVEAFAAKINLLAESAATRKAMGEYNRAKVEKMFSLKRMLKQYQALFEEILSG